MHHLHTDFGYTDHQSICRRNQINYINQAVDYILATENYPEGSRFAWTQEQIQPLRDWWEASDQNQKERFFKALKTGRLEVTGTPFNVTAFLSAEEWEAAMTWIPDELWESLNIKSAMQIDVNGMHTKGLEYIYNKGIKNLWMGPNSYYGVSPIPSPAAFNWQISENKNIFVWLNASYNNGYFIFNDDWRQGPVPSSSDLRYRPPEAGDIWACDNESIIKAHKKCLENLALLEGNTVNNEAKTDGFTKNRIYGGYTLETLPVSVTNQWRIDNDPPFLPIADFVRKWNDMKLEPRLMLCTVSEAMDMVHTELGDDIQTYSGQWIDWWANGNASSPVELAINRTAKRVLKSAKSELFGAMTESQKRDARQIIEDICLYDEHSFGSWQSVSDPYSFNTRAQSAEKNSLTYRALDNARYLLAERVRPLLKDIKNEIVVWNTADLDINTTIELPLNCMRGEYHSVFCKETGKYYPISYTDGIANFLRPSGPEEFSPENISRTFSDKCKNQAIAFGEVYIPSKGCLHFVPQHKHCDAISVKNNAVLIETDENCWPVKVKFENEQIPIISGDFGNIISVKADGFSPRWTFKDIFETDNPAEREKLREQHLSEVYAKYHKAECIEKNNCIYYEQLITHPSLNYGKRILKIDKLNSKINLELRIDRRSDFSPEVLFLYFRAPKTKKLPYISNAELPFQPVAGQLPGSCMDFYAFDGWINYPNGWMLNCRDNALVSFGNTGVVSRKNELMGNTYDIYIRLFDNIWDTNFTANACGIMSFTFTATNNIELENAVKTADAMNTEPVVAVKMGCK